MSDPLWPAMAPPAWRAIAAAPRDETRHETDDGYTYEFDVNHPPSAAIAAAPQLRRDKYGRYHAAHTMRSNHHRADDLDVFTPGMSTQAKYWGQDFHGVPQLYGGTPPAAPFVDPNPFQMMSQSTNPQSYSWIQTRVQSDHPAAEEAVTSPLGMDYYQTQHSDFNDYLLSSGLRSMQAYPRRQSSPPGFSSSHVPPGHDPLAYGLSAYDLPAHGMPAYDPPSHDPPATSGLPFTRALPSAFPATDGQPANHTRHYRQIDAGLHPHGHSATHGKPYPHGQPAGHTVPSTYAQTLTHSNPYSHIRPVTHPAPSPYGQAPTHGQPPARSPQPFSHTVSKNHISSRIDKGKGGYGEHVHGKAPVNARPPQNMAISMIELCTFFPNYFVIPEVIMRALRNGWPRKDIATAELYAIGKLTIDDLKKAENRIQKQISDGGKIALGLASTMHWDNEKYVKQLTRQDDLTSAQWQLRSQYPRAQNGNRRHRQMKFEDVMLADIHSEVDASRWPTGQDRLLLTQCLEFDAQNPHLKLTTADYGRIVRHQGLTEPPGLNAQQDVDALARFRQLVADPNA